MLPLESVSTTNLGPVPLPLSVIRIMAASLPWLYVFARWVGGWMGSWEKMNEAISAKDREMRKCAHIL